MKQRYWLYRRGALFYLQDSVTGKRESLQTSDPRHAQRLRTARNEAAEKPLLGLTLGKAYLSAYDPELLRRTWTLVMDQFCTRGKESSRLRHARAVKSPVFDPLREKVLIETTPDELRRVLADGRISTNHFLRCLHNLAVGLGWLPWPIIPTKLWPAVSPKAKRGITFEEHALILSAEKNVERMHYYDLLWEVGAAQSDGAVVTAANIDWNRRVFSYQRQKTGGWARLTIGVRLEKLLRNLPVAGLLFPHIAAMNAGERSAEFCRRCRTLKLKGVSLHSYRYAWAERAKTVGYPERFAQEALGHNSKAVHRAYARGAHVVLPSLESYEGDQAQGTSPGNKSVVTPERPIVATHLLSAEM